MNDYSNPNLQQPMQQEPQKQGSNDALLTGAIAAIVGAGLGVGGVAVAGTLSDTPEVEIEEETTTEETQEEIVEPVQEPEVIHVIHHVHHRPGPRMEPPQGGRAIAQVGDFRVTSVEVMQQHVMPDGTRILGAHCHINGRPGVIVDVNGDGIADALNYDQNGDGLVNENTIDLRPYGQTISMGTLAQHADHSIGAGSDALVDGEMVAAIGGVQQTAGNATAQQTTNTGGNGTATIETVNVTTGNEGDIALNNNIDPDLPDYTNNANVAAIDTASGNVMDLAMANKQEEAEVQVEEPQVEVAQAEVQVEEPQVEVAQAEVQVEEPQVEVAQAEVQVEEPQVEVAQAEVQVEEPQVEVEEPEVQPELPTADESLMADNGMGGMDNGMDSGMDTALPDDGGVA